MIEFNTNLPIYIQITEFIRNQIISGELSPGEKLESVRSYAEMYEVNPNTVQRALSDLESTGLIYSKRAVGKFVTDDKKLINLIRERQIDVEIRNMLEKLYSQGYSKEEIYSSLKNLLKEENINE
ncbi:GntR family transcriptional regulator [Peptostreptococcus russellii]|uniref:DNA-binding transcriptional regulator YhcF, GntR family n=1 Tax=Peptostreptococcus russellii TaxID=215200 RepID=A0A1H8GQ29_9FIRM|nr:GntR family transcriptional regulator [Peptostreptococcus russellii]SEN46221.1 DNA-binding transcriptional regulator YhcF, GntR family [Peptostreptococcus russellii]